MTIRVVLADDQEMVRIGFAMILSGADDIEVVDQAADGVEAVAAIRRHRPDVALLDIRMPRLDGLEVCRQVSGDTAVVIVTTFGEDEYVDAAIAGGASGFLLKDAGAELLLAAVRAAASGDALISPQLTTSLLARTGARARSVPAELTDRIATLSEREREVVCALAAGASNARIAETLFVSLSTVKTHVAAISRKLGVDNRVAIAAAAWRAGLMDDPPR